jgi:hypothetical protein
MELEIIGHNQTGGALELTPLLLELISKNVNYRVFFEK